MSMSHLRLENTIQRTLIAILIFAGLSLRVSAQQYYTPNSDTTWAKEQEPFRIAGNLYYVGSYELCSYLITTPKGHILINTGIPGSETMIRKHIEALGFKYSDIKILLTNQAHFDHVGAMAAVKKETGARLMIEEKDAPVVADGGNSDFDLGGHGPMFAPVKADRLLHDRDIVKLGGMEIMVLHHPGHTKGACSYLFSVKDSARSYRVLIVNVPSIISMTKLPSMSTYPEVGKDYAYSLDTIPKIHYDIWLASHASQFDLQAKYKPGVYNPMVFADRALLDSTIQEIRVTYNKRMTEKS